MSFGQQPSEDKYETSKSLTLNNSQNKRIQSPFRVDGDWCKIIWKISFYQAV